MKTDELEKYQQRIAALSKGESGKYEDVIQRLNLLLSDIQSTHDARIEEDLIKQLEGLLLTTEELKSNAFQHK